MRYLARVAPLLLTVAPWLWGCDAAPHWSAPPPGLEAALAKLDGGYLVDYRVTETRATAAGARRNRGTLLVGGDLGTEIALADAAGYTVALAGGVLYRQAPGEARTVASGLFQPSRGRYLPLHQTPEGLREFGRWAVTTAGDSTAYASGGSAGFPGERKAVAVVVDDRTGRILSITTPEGAARGGGHGVRWDYTDWRDADAVAGLMTSRLGRLLEE